MTGARAVASRPAASAAAPAVASTHRAPAGALAPQRLAEGFSFARIGIQPKLQVSRPGDAFETEADAVAERVMRTPAGPAAAPVQVTAWSPAPVARQAATPEAAAPGEDDPQPDPSVLLSLKSEGASPPTVSGALESRVRSLGSGTPLDPGTRTFFESRFGHDFGRVRVHADGAAAGTARDINARAFTLGSDIAFAPGEYRPQTPEGQRLLAHELTHVLQQGEGLRMVMRACACNAIPGARDPSVGESTFLTGQFPRLAAGNWCVTAPATGSYNCFAWSGGITSRWVDTEVDTAHGNNNGTLEISDFDAWYATMGLRPYVDQTPMGAEVALYSKGSTPTHAARRSTAGCGFAFESKLGTYLRIVHDVHELEGGAAYGNLNRFYAP